MRKTKRRRSLGYKKPLSRGGEAGKAFGGGKRRSVACITSLKSASLYQTSQLSRYFI